MTAIIALVVLVIVVAVRGDVDVDATDIKPKDAVRRVPQRFAVFGYVGQVESDVDGQKPFDYEAAFQSGVTHFIIHSIWVSSEGLPTGLERLPSKEQASAARAATDKVGGKILLSLGGGQRPNGDDNHYGYMSEKAHRRRKFVVAVDAILSEYRFDGVDFGDYEPRREHMWGWWRAVLEDAKARIAIVTISIMVKAHRYQKLVAHDIVDEVDFVFVKAMTMSATATASTATWRSMKKV